MRERLIFLGASLLLAGCQPTAMTPAAPDKPRTGWKTSAAAPGYATKSEKMVRWEKEWADAKQNVAKARTKAVAARRPIPPAVDAEVTEIVNREVPVGPTEEVRLQRLQEAVSDARRLALLVSAG